MKLSEMTAREVRDLFDGAGIEEMRVWSNGRVFFARTEGRRIAAAGGSGETLIAAIESALQNAGVV